MSQQELLHLDILPGLLLPAELLGIRQQKEYYSLILEILNEVLAGGKDYDGGSDISATGALSPELDKLVTGYGLFENTENYKVDFLIMGSANYDKESAQSTRK